jgi:hypothetical protein
MIQAKELMIGNYLYCEYSGEIIQVTEIKNDGVYASSNKTVIERYYYYEEIHSIPIDEKWLTDFGFKYLEAGFYNKSGWYYNLDNQDQKTFIFLNNHFDVSILINTQFQNFFIDTDIKSIHSLQNLYFALTGKELELKQNMK